MSLMICELGHAQLVYDSARWLCPACALMDLVREWKRRWEEADRARDELAATVDDLESRLACAIEPHHNRADPPQAPHA
jgi:hypothetical protein